MNNEEKMQKLEHMQNYFFWSFVVSFVFLFFATFMCIAMHDVQIAFVNKYFPMEAEDYNYLVVLLLGVWKILIFQFTLIPALVLWCLRKCCCCKCKG